jgi:uncharacterized BrkB/YihY/UPF0761 family membrane protein
MIETIGYWLFLSIFAPLLVGLTLISWALMLKIFMEIIPSIRKIIPRAVEDKIDEFF